MINMVVNATKNNTVTSTEHMVKYFIGTMYLLIFIPGFFGNILIILSIVRFKRMQTAFNIFLGNLAITDLLFILSSLFTLVKIMKDNEWLFGGIFCKIHATILECSFTCSVCTLAVVAHERYTFICYPHKKKKTIKQTLIVCAAIWFLSFMICSPLLYGSKVSLNSKGLRRCSNNVWSNKVRLVFYLVHTVFLYILPLIAMCYTHAKIWKALAYQRRSKSLKSPSKTMNTRQESPKTTPETNFDVLNQRENAKRIRVDCERNAKIIRLLVIIILVFIIVWTPYIVIRIFVYFGHFLNPFIYRLGQLLILSSTGTNFIIYSIVNPAFRKCFKELLIPNICRKNRTSSVRYKESEKTSEVKIEN